MNAPTAVWGFFVKGELKDLLSIIRGIDPDAFYTTEIVGEVNKIHDIIQSPTGWRAVLKKK